MNKKHPVRLLFAGLSAVAIACWGIPALAQSSTALEQRIRKITERPEFAHSRFGIKFIAADTGNVVYELNSSQLFVPGSTTKLLTEGTALELFGGDYRFRTKIYRTGPIQKDGTLQGDLVLVASGDLNLSNRIQADGSLAFEDHDHTYGGPDSVGLPGDPLVVMREFARQVAAKGIKRVGGRVLVDATLFAEGERELGTGVVISPIVVNDNVVDVIVSAGAEERSAVRLKIAPQTGYVTIINQATTGKAGSRTSLRYEKRETQRGWNPERHADRQHGSRCKTRHDVLRGSGAEPLCRRSFGRGAKSGGCDVKSCGPRGADRFQSALGHL